MCRARRSNRRLALVALSTAPLVACGGGSHSPTTPTATPTPGYSVNVTVFYDENGNGQLNPGEAARVPDVDVVIGSGTGKTARNTGVAVVTGVHEGAQTVNLRTESLPTYYQPGPPIPVQVPGTADVNYPVTLPIGQNNASVYLGYGDSITSGDGSSDGKGYAPRLQGLLGPYFGRAEVETWGRQGTMSREGATRTRTTLGWFHPAYLLIHYGTNDWNDQACQNQGTAACFTIDSLRQMVEDAKSVDTLPVLATLIPVNPAIAPAGRNTWTDDMNVLIKALAREQGVMLADLNAAFKAQPSLPPLYVDHVHPNDAGYDVMAQGWFAAITQARSAAAAASHGPRFGFSLH
jgi:lysophospholipase L1-like esterase